MLSYKRQLSMYIQIQFVHHVVDYYFVIKTFASESLHSFHSIAGAEFLDCLCLIFSALPLRITKSW